MRNRLDHELYTYTKVLYRAQANEMRAEVCAAEALAAERPESQVPTPRIYPVPEQCKPQDPLPLLMELAADGISAEEVRAGRWRDPKACPDEKYGLLDVTHNGDRKIGDVCRANGTDGHDTRCPTGCTTHKSKLLRCMMVDRATKRHPTECRVDVPVLCSSKKGKAAGCIFINETDRRHYNSNPLSFTKAKRGESSPKKYVETFSPSWTREYN